MKNLLITTIIATLPLIAAPAFAADEINVSNGDVINTTLDLITFAGPHNWETGDWVLGFPPSTFSPFGTESGSTSALFPGSLDSTGFWHDVLASKDLISDVPASHWLHEDYYDADPKAPDKTYAKRGAFLGDVDFDALAWGIPPSIVPATDTSQLLALIKPFHKALAIGEA